MSMRIGSTGGYAWTTTEPVTATPFTISVWFKVPDAANNYYAVAIDTPDVAGYEILGTVEAGGNVGGDPVRVFNYDSSSFGVAATSSGFSTDTWTHACGTFTNATLRAAFIDGGGKGTNTDNIVGTPSELVIGRRRRNSAIGNFPANSFIAEVAVWDAVLSDANVALLAGGSNPKAIDAGNLIAYWPLTTVTELSDEQGSNDLTKTGGAAFNVDHPTIDSPVVELSGTIAAQSTVSGDLTLSECVELSGTIAAQSTVSGNLGSVFVSVNNSVTRKRVVAVGNNQVWIEDI